MLSTDLLAVKRRLRNILSIRIMLVFEFFDLETNKYIGGHDILEVIGKDQNFEYEIKNEGLDAAMGAVQGGRPMV